ncbi:class I SAM-dependent methyltransferase [Ktedonosporobacter rubrisoli]|uniref:Class I SAM-dependent methyltransferase n=1 Tax=Ktedonosporobacter rubrisoli TaxID=2509675 RepID=A0A4P6JIE1_KTERU|nr:class I SAM-dependent methyltransferase [Ktedonosporobacter rubrisoli]QBD74837.1 class I SAM-dependent methyltransferase [Ktedonosporobacter rubrisoli]
MDASDHLINQDFWNAVVPHHTSSAFYNLEVFKAGATSLLPIELEEVGSVEGKTLLHLQCHFGMDTLSWARLGARVTGVDFSEQAIAFARSLAQELGLDASFICADIYDLPNKLSEQFEIVFTSYGVLCWLPDIERWARVVADFIQPGGTFYIIDGHPLTRIFSSDPHATGATDLKVASSYFMREPAIVEVRGSYADSGEEFPPKKMLNWNHSLGDILSALIQAGLTIEFLHEFPVMHWAPFPFLKQGEDRLWHFSQGDPQLPLLFSIRATKG